MNQRIQLSKLSVAKILSKWPALAHYFNQRRLHCVGCPMAAFETLADVASEYGINRRSLQQELESLVMKEKSANDSSSVSMKVKCFD
ncbi:MAG: DUF1858 domain-containing protein [Deltaproteobacteria bacterium]|nr:DUF1858 domain-containing protein [Deltaproteobacteria bacterium]